MTRNLILKFSNNNIFELSFKFDYDGYLTYDLYGKNDFFSGKSSICFFKENLVSFGISIINLKIDESSILTDNDSDSYIKIIKVDDLGHYNLIIQVGGTHQDNFCKITFFIDQFTLEKLYKFVII